MWDDKIEVWVWGGGEMKKNITGQSRIRQSSTVFHVSILPWKIIIPDYRILKLSGKRGGDGGRGKGGKNE
jgi:hypothetical protein